MNNRMKWTRHFIHSTGAILLAAAITRFAILIGHDQVLALPDPLLGIPLLYAVLVVGVVELAIALVCLLSKRTGFQLALPAWWAMVGTAFAIGLFASHCHPQITCLGGLTDPFQLHHGLVGQAMNVMPVYFVLGSFIFAADFHRRRGGSTAPHPQPPTRQPGMIAPFIKIACPQCGGHSEFSEKLIVERIPCPHCKTGITLEKAKCVKMSCPGCGGHIEFSCEAFGQKVGCPRCGREITLKHST
jgi:xanthosine utilization system XapX-like protein